MAGRLQFPASHPRLAFVSTHLCCPVLGALCGQREGKLGRNAGKLVFASCCCHFTACQGFLVILKIRVIPEEDLVGFVCFYSFIFKYVYVSLWGV